MEEAGCDIIDHDSALVSYKLELLKRSNQDVIFKKQIVDHQIRPGVSDSVCDSCWSRVVPDGSGPLGSLRSDRDLNTWTKPQGQKDLNSESERTSLSVLPQHADVLSTVLCCSRLQPQLLSVFTEPGAAERQTERQGETGRDRETERQRERDRQTDRQTDRQRDRETERQRDRERERVNVNLGLRK